MPYDLPASSCVTYLPKDEDGIQISNVWSWKFLLYFFAIRVHAEMRFIYVYECILLRALTSVCVLPKTASWFRDIFYMSFFTCNFTICLRYFEENFSIFQLFIVENRPKWCSKLGKKIRRIIFHPNIRFFPRSGFNIMASTEIQNLNFSIFCKFIFLAFCPPPISQKIDRNNKCLKVFPKSLKKERVLPWKIF